MAKYIRKWTAVLLIFALAVCAVGCEKEPDDPNVRYFYGAGREVEPPKAFVIETTEQLERHIKWIIGDPKEVKVGTPEYVDPNSVESGEGKPFAEYCDVYTDSFFEEHYLVIAYCELPSCSYLIQSQGAIHTPNGELKIYLDAVMEKEKISYEDGSYGADDGAAGWHIIYEFDRNAGVPNQEAIDVYVDSHINIFKDAI